MVADIEEHGCQVISVSKSAAGPGWAYTAGVFDTCGQPEIITVGLLPATAHYLLNNAAGRLRAGDDLTRCRQAGMIGEVDCEFRPVDRKWVEHLMGWANWYNEGVD